MFELLLVLTESEGRLVTKDKLVETVWRGLSVSDATISARINAARKVIGDNVREQAVVKTVHGRGFQLISKLHKNPPSSAKPRSDDHAISQSIKFTPSSHNAKIAYAQSGESPPLHRVGHWLSHLELDRYSPVWRPLIETLGKQHTLNRYDQRGARLSSRDLTGPDLDAFTDDLKSVADATFKSSLSLPPHQQSL